MRFLSLVLLLACIPTTTWADYILGPPEVNSSLKALTRFVKEGEEAKTAFARADALAKVAKEANYLASLINFEIRSHGLDQKRLIDLAVLRCGELGVVISYDSRKQRYLYDQSAYAEYLRLDPFGPEGQEARFMVFERTFYAQKSDDRSGMTRLVGDIEQFLSLYPKDGRRSELELFLVVLYRDLSRMKAEEPGGGLRERMKVERLCEEIMSKYPTTPEARVAETILKNLR